MSSKSQQPVTNIGLFYKQIEDFKEKLIHILKQYEKNQEIIELHKYYDKLMTFKKVNVRKPIELFYEYCVLLTVDEVLTRDDSFFLGEFSKIEKIQSTSSDTVDGIDNIHNVEKIKQGIEKVTKKDIFFISQIRDVWTALPPNVKNNVWDYIQVICILAEKIVGGSLLADRRASLMTKGQLNST